MVDFPQHFVKIPHHLNKMHKPPRQSYIRPNFGSKGQSNGQEYTGESFPKRKLPAAAGGSNGPQEEMARWGMP